MNQLGDKRYELRKEVTLHQFLEILVVVQKCVVLGNVGLLNVPIKLHQLHNFRNVVEALEVARLERVDLALAQQVADNVLHQHVDASIVATLVEASKAFLEAVVGCLEVFVEHSHKTRALLDDTHDARLRDA
ncbi:hypothetical protein OGATHE_004128 [Ogataea polymorpha]|uniref:Uncharacterized protein n=1 Tax=Ogataea polymorpha TaxID=460523 RepID=A0A9P8P4Z3_9ASCO|nr:hypothetical protein OGATHE_004128 [Ogataea polymorpha]